METEPSFLPNSERAEAAMRLIQPAVEVPRLTDAALAARYAAQRKILGDEALFEDLEGRPIALAWHAQLAVESQTPSMHAPETAEVDADESGDFLDRLPGSSGLGAAMGLEPATYINGNSLGLYIPLENSHEAPLENFYGALRQLESEPKGPDGTPRKVRVLVYGASHTQADVFPDYLRTYLQTRFGAAGHGYIALVRTNRWYKHLDLAVESSRGWRVEHAQSRKGRSDGHYGLLGASAATSHKRDYARVVPRVTNAPYVLASQYEIHYLNQPKGGRFQVRVDGRDQAIVRTRATRHELAVHRFEIEEGAHDIEIRPLGDGEVRVFGLVAERNEPGVVVDTLGISGTRVTNHLSWNEDIWRESVQRRDPALYILAYGTNEATDGDESFATYEQRLRGVLERFRRTLPRASCILVGPGDFALQVSESVFEPQPRVSDVVRIQQRVAPEFGCGFWDLMAFMGGPGSIELWANSQPQMASKDHIHLTRRGYVRMGMALTDALMLDYDAKM